MSFWDYALLAAIGGYMAWLLFRPKLFRPKKKKCSGDCSCCKGCQG